ncbi:serine hydrolase domain-containing protein [Paenibacillus alvei]|uniref:serine hydrolase domain-containing protein n=1 Tax=Paenibacillus alvei TaxID=44250 RepID=UPI0018CCE1BF|nr:serine hydrolase [Paenibacillus alvei]MBG9734874.1 beta-lactamase [Paenibacillus alvei]MBG9744749.1 beta-lactamase [Paenibacillus alvei]MCY9578827.1 beta-lactamase family protein [Paenibacillus alvei]MCY9583883.1 beta-lactamase family protein [Paenibacillus alvei]
MNRQEAMKEIERQFRGVIQRNRKLHNAYFLVHCEPLGIHLNIAEGKTRDQSALPQQRYYIASISKLFTSVLIAMLAEEGKLSYEDPIHRYLPPDLMHKLHVYKGTDYSNQIQIKHLLSHTSGLHDYFEDRPKQGSRMLDLFTSEPSRQWTPQEVIQWSKEHLKSHFPPGQGIHYSDTGYHLLGLLIESITSTPLHEAFRHYLFEPLQLHHTHMAFYSMPAEEDPYPIADLYADQTVITDYKSISMEYAGGALISTSDNLLTFMKALTGGKLISADSFQRMQVWTKFRPGVDYGYGIVRFRTVPLFLPAKYNVWGAWGYSGTFMFYHPALDAYLIGSLNQLRSTAKAVRIMFKAIDVLLRCK